LKSGGALTLIWRADGLADVLAALERGFGSVAILPVHGDEHKPAIRVLVRAIKGGKAPMQIHLGLVLNNKSAALDKEVDELMNGNRKLVLAIP
jgi:tRNA1(Val) A37 N6-methylase TrmN6